MVKMAFPEKRIHGWAGASLIKYSSYVASWSLRRSGTLTRIRISRIKLYFHSHRLLPHCVDNIKLHSIIHWDRLWSESIYLIIHLTRESSISYTAATSTFAASMCPSRRTNASIKFLWLLFLILQHRQWIHITDVNQGLSYALIVFALSVEGLWPMSWASDFERSSRLKRRGWKSAVVKSQIWHTTSLLKFSPYCFILSCMLSNTTRF